MLPGQEANGNSLGKYFQSLYNNGMLCVLIRIASLSMHNIQFHDKMGEGLGEANVSCILRHLGIQLILACCWTRPAIFAAGRGRGGIFLFLLFLHFHSFSFLPCPSLSSPLLSLLSLFSLYLGDDTK